AWCDAAGSTAGRSEGRSECSRRGDGVWPGEEGGDGSGMQAACRNGSGESPLQPWRTPAGREYQFRMFVGSPFTKRFMMVRPTFSPYARISPPPPFGAVLPTHTPMTMSGV